MPQTGIIGASSTGIEGRRRRTSTVSQFGADINAERAGDRSLSRTWFLLLGTGEEASGTAPPQQTVEAARRVESTRRSFEPSTRRPGL